MPETTLKTVESSYKIFSPLTAGISVSGRAINAYTNNIHADKYLYLLAGVHGDEKEGVYLLQCLLKFLDNSNLNLPNIIAIPILNVDGYIAKQRTNTNKVDLNRNLPTQDWSEIYNELKYYPGPKPLSEPENNYLVDLFNTYKPYFIFSFHSWKAMINYNGACDNVASFLSKYNCYPITHDIGYPTPGSLGTYAPKTYNAPVITFECPIVTAKELPNVWQENQEAMQQLFQQNFIPDNFL